MKWKYIIIIVLIAFLTVTVYKMMRYEETIREEKIIKIQIEDETKPLITPIPDEQLKRFSKEADYYFISKGDYFKTLNTRFEYDKKVNYWEEIFLKGVNIGVATPGKFPAEFSLSFEQYLEWFKLIGEMNSNVIRTYTILPPEFYNAFAYYNFHNQNKKLFLMQGVWAKIPDDENYFNAQYTRGFQKEIIDVIDLIHGKSVINEKSGHANGTYACDISKYVIGILLGREWEPKAVIETNHLNKINHYSGKFISMNQGTAMEAWLAKMMDFTVLYETQTYKAQRPISFVNWLPLDPMFHNSEFIENKKIREYDNDIESIDFRKFHSTDLFYPGIYAAYHAYPYYPDFIYLQKNYANSTNKYGQKDNYFAYLKDLKNHCKGIPLVIAEYGLPSSRGNSHYTPLGFNQGGHSEKEQAELSILLTKDIFDTKCAGAIYFEWIDEWFKHNWLVMDFEKPYHNRKLWHNMENPEQNFGIYAYESRTKTIDGKLNDWKNIKIPKNKISVNADADAGYFYLMAGIPDFDFSKNNLYIAIDIFDKNQGDHRLPFLKKEIENGIEFLVEFYSMDNAKILVDDKYSVYTNIYNSVIPVYASKNNNNGIFIEQKLMSNRAKETLFGNIIDSILHNRGNLIHGNSSLAKSSNSDWYWDYTSKTLELRLPWHLLNVSDPSGRYVLDDIKNTADIEYSKTDGFNIYLFVTDKNNNVITRYPKRKAYNFSWETWETPQFKRRLKPIYKSLGNYFYLLNPPEIPQDFSSKAESFRITDFYNNKKGAISISFVDAGYTQLKYALPQLEKYYLNASFGIIENSLEENPRLLADEGSFKIKRLGINDVQKLVVKGNEIVLQRTIQSSENLSETKKIFEHKTATIIKTIHFSAHAKRNIENKTLENLGILFAKSRFNNNFYNNINSLNYYSLQSIIISDKYPSQYEFDSIIANGKGKWIIFSYHHLFPVSSKEYKLFESGKYKNTYSISPKQFERQIRLIRNSDYWIAPISTIGKYQKERENSTIRTTKYSNLTFLSVINKLDKKNYKQPLTIEYITSSKKIRVTGSVADGIYNNREGKIYLNVLPNKEVTIEILD
ncbi:MAG: hypothetical protein U9R42_13555 [Bacteroidota bacterium]|nr:hypothetical protein [Bacteroidota bacterium]